MTSWRITLSHITGVTVGAYEVSVLIDLCQFTKHVQTEAGFIVTLGAGCDGNVRLQTSDGPGLRNVDMTGRTLSDMVALFAPTVVLKLHRNALWQ